MTNSHLEELKTVQITIKVFNQNDDVGLVLIRPGRSHSLFWLQIFLFSVTEALRKLALIPTQKTGKSKARRGDAQDGKGFTRRASSWITAFTIHQQEKSAVFSFMLTFPAK